VSADEIRADDALAAIEMFKDPEQDEQIAKLEISPLRTDRTVFEEAH
jgi:hypothetical protein